MTCFFFLPFDILKIASCDHCSCDFGCFSTCKVGVSRGLGSHWAEVYMTCCLAITVWINVLPNHYGLWLLLTVLGVI